MIVANCNELNFFSTFRVMLKTKLENVQVVILFLVKEEVKVKNPKKYIKLLKNQFLKVNSLNGRTSYSFNSIVGDIYFQKASRKYQSKCFLIYNFYFL